MVRHICHRRRPCDNLQSTQLHQNNQIWIQIRGSLFSIFSYTCTPRRQTVESGETVRPEVRTPDYSLTGGTWKSFTLVGSAVNFLDDLDKKIQKTAWPSWFGSTRLRKQWNRTAATNDTTKYIAQIFSVFRKLVLVVLLIDLSKPSGRRS